MKKRKDHTFLKNFCFLQNWHVYPNDTLVCIGMTKPEIVAFIRDKEKGKEKWKTGVAEDFENTKTPIGDKGYFWYPDEAAQSILIINEWDGSWDNFETLIHELHHAVHIMLGEKRGMAGEVEALAYAQEYLFRSIRKKILKKQTKR